VTGRVADAETAADIGPQLTCSVHDDALGPLGWVVLDRALPGVASGGGIRAAPDLTLDEVAVVARAMTLKWAFLNIPHGGAKAGIVLPADLDGTRRAEMLSAFGRAIRPLLERGVYFTGPDLGTTLDDANAVRLGAGTAAERHSDADGGRATATTVVQGVKEAAAVAGIDVRGATVAIEGFGRVGREVAVRLAALGARIVAASVHDRALYAGDGLALDALAAHSLDGDASTFRNGRRIEPAELLTLPVDVLVPCARPWTINRGNVERVQAKAVVPASNAPLTEEADRALNARGVTVMPDFVANCGGILYPYMRYRGFGFDAFVRLVETVLAERMRSVLAAAHPRGQTANDVAARIAWRNFGRQAAVLEQIPPSGAARQVALLRHHGLGALPARVASLVHARTRSGRGATAGAAWRWLVASTRDAG
jgi:glutamate dehydrogenase/leucine dehydrogenase